MNGFQVVFCQPQVLPVVLSSAPVVCAMVLNGLQLFASICSELHFRWPRVFADGAGWLSRERLTHRLLEVNLTIV